LKKKENLAREIIFSIRKRHGKEKVRDFSRKRSKVFMLMMIWPIDQQQEMGHLEIVKYLLDKGAKYSCF